jgi:hypothetical protein
MATTSNIGDYFIEVVFIQVRLKIYLITLMYIFVKNPEEFMYVHYMYILYMYICTI